MPGREDFIRAIHRREGLGTLLLPLPVCVHQEAVVAKDCVSEFLTIRAPDGPGRSSGSSTSKLLEGASGERVSPDLPGGAAVGEKGQLLAVGAPTGATIFVLVVRQLTSARAIAAEQEQVVAIALTIEGNPAAIGTQVGAGVGKLAVG